MIMNQVAPSAGNTSDSSNGMFMKAAVAPSATVEANSFCSVNMTKLAAYGSIAIPSIILSDTEEVWKGVSDSNGKIKCGKIVLDDVNLTVDSPGSYTGPTRSNTYCHGYNVFCNGKYFAYVYGSGTTCYIDVVDLDTATLVGEASWSTGYTETGCDRAIVKTADNKFWIGPSSKSSSKRVYTIADDGTLSYATSSSTYTGLAPSARHAPSTSNANRYVSVEALESYDSTQETYYVSGAMLRIGTFGKQTSSKTVCSGVFTGWDSYDMEWSMDERSTPSNTVIYVSMLNDHLTKYFYKVVIDGSDNVTVTTVSSPKGIYVGNGLVWNGQPNSSTHTLYDIDTKEKKLYYDTGDFENYYDFTITKALTTALFRGIQNGNYGYYGLSVSMISGFSDDDGIADGSYAFALSGGSDGEIINIVKFLEPTE